MSNSERQLLDSQLPYLETFSRAAELCSFTKAGKSLGMSQAAVSQRIHTLEKLLGKPLFDRKGTRILLTESGQQLYEYARQILGLHREALEAITGSTAPVTGELFLAASSIPGEHLLPDLLSAFRNKYPRIRVRATIMDSMAVMSEVEHGNVQLGLVGRKSDSPHLEFRNFASDEMIVIVPADHPWRRRKTIPFDQFAKQPLVLREPGSGTVWCFEQALAACDKTLNDVAVILELGSNEAIKGAVLKGMGISVLSRRAVQKELANGQLCGLKISGLALQRCLYVIRDTRRVQPGPARTFLSYLESSMPVDSAR